MSAYFAVGDDGLIKEVYSNEELQDSYQELFPDDPADVVSDSLSSGEYVPAPSVSPDTEEIQDNEELHSESVPVEDVSPGDAGASIEPVPFVIDYDELAHAISLQQSYELYPSQNAVSVFTNVLAGLDNDVYYVVQAGGDSNTAYMWYSEDATISGRNITLASPVTVCEYSQYRDGAPGYQTHYNYYVRSSGDTSFSPTTQLVYTNCIDGYPDISGSASTRVLGNYGFVLVLLVGVILGVLFLRRKTL